MCLWLMGVGRPGDRPDRLGLLFAPAVSDEGEMGAWAFEHRPGAASTERGRSLIDHVASRLPIIIAEDVRLAPGLTASVLTLREPPKAPALRERRRPLRAPRAHRRRR